MLIILGYRVNSVDLYRKIAYIEEGNFKEIWGIVFKDNLLDIIHL